MSRLLYLPLLALLLWPAAALATDAPPASPTLVLPTDQLWAFVAGCVVPLATYAINKWAPWTSERVKGIVHVIAAAVGGGIVQAVTAGGVGLNSTTLQFVVTAVVAALGAHKALWLPSGLSWLFGGGQNRQGQLANPAPVAPAK